jgi:hypothetical protein
MKRLPDKLEAQLPMELQLLVIFYENIGEQENGERLCKNKFEGGCEND